MARRRTAQAPQEDPQVDPNDQQEDPTIVEPIGDTLADVLAEEDQSEEVSEQEESDEPDLVEVQVGGRTLKLSPEDADALQEALKPRPAPQPTTQAPTTKTPEPDPLEGLDSLLFTEPKQAINRITAAVETKLRAEYQQVQAREQFWNGFFGSNPDLKEVPDLVDTVLQRNIQELGPLAPQAAQKKLAELTRKEVVKIARLGKNTRSLNAEPGNSRTSPKPRPQPQQEKPSSLIASLKARQAARRQATSVARAQETK